MTTYYTHSAQNRAQNCKKSAESSIHKTSEKTKHSRKLDALCETFANDVWPNVMSKIKHAELSGLSEFEILKHIQEKHGTAGVFINFSTPQALFPIHFLLFHHLYCWQQKLVTNNDNQSLHISALNIKLTNTMKTNALSEIDALGSYYRDLENLYQTTNESLEAMLNQFWNRFCALDDIGDAFKTLELSPTDEIPKIKQHYKKQMAQHHPDKGGCPKKAQEINHAYHTIKKAMKV